MGSKLYRLQWAPTHCSKGANIKPMTGSGGSFSMANHLCLPWLLGDSSTHAATLTWGGDTRRDSCVWLCWRSNCQSSRDQWPWDKEKDLLVLNGAIHYQTSYHRIEKVKPLLDKQLQHHLSSFDISGNYLHYIRVSVCTTYRRTWAVRRRRCEGIGKCTGLPSRNVLLRNAFTGREVRGRIGFVTAILSRVLESKSSTSYSLKFRSQQSDQIHPIPYAGLPSTFRSQAEGHACICTSPCVASGSLVFLLRLWCHISDIISLGCGSSVDRKNILKLFHLETNFVSDLCRAFATYLIGRNWWFQNVSDSFETSFPAGKRSFVGKLLAAPGHSRDGYWIGPLKGV